MEARKAPGETPALGEQGKGPAGWRAVSLSMALAFVAVLPFLLRGNTGVTDLTFHVSSWIEVNRQWHEGTLYPRWAAGANYGLGEPRFFFYPPLSWMLGAALGTILPWRAVPGAFTWLVLTLSGISMYCLARETLAPHLSLWAAVLYATNPYMFVVAYVRGSFAELLAAALFPLVVLATLRAGHPRGRGLVPLTLGTAVMWLTNVPAAVISTYSVALLLGVKAIQQRRVRPLLEGGAATALGLALAAFYLVPAIREQSWINITWALREQMRPQDNFLFSASAFPLLLRVNLILSALAMAEIGLFAVALAGARRINERSRGVLLPLGTLGVFAALLLFRPSRFVWDLLPYAQFVQFPWRVLFVLNVAVVLALVAAEPRGGPGRVWRGLLLCAWLFLAGFALAFARWDPGYLQQTVATIQKGDGYQGMPEYISSTTDWRWLIQASVAPDKDLGGLPVGLPGSVLLQEDAGARVTEIKASSEEHSFSVEALQPTRLILKLMGYPAWRLDVNGMPAALETLPQKGLIVLNLPRGRSGVRVYLARTPDRTAGAVISVCAATLLLVLGWRGRRPGTGRGL